MSPGTWRSCRSSISSDTGFWKQSHNTTPTPGCPPVSPPPREHWSHEPLPLCERHSRLSRQGHPQASLVRNPIVFPHETHLPSRLALALLTSTGDRSRQLYSIPEGEKGRGEQAVSPQRLAAPLLSFVLVARPTLVHQPASRLSWPSRLGGWGQGDSRGPSRLRQALGIPVRVWREKWGLFGA